ncbi:MAG: RNA polymerase sigma factor [Planctomycetes bacterium]|nr:RNA polymerase sigma factor [Planctomycetota bacterium]NOG54717.1 RNA polymerase sigma factor [Planctomycetota bacterium]
MNEDWELMQRVSSGDPNAVNELYTRFGTLVYRMAYQLLRTKGDAEDAVQEIFVRLWQSAGRFDPERASLVTWVMLISRRHLVDMLRRKRVRPQMAGFDEAWVEPAGADGPAPEDGLLEEEWKLKLRERVSMLPGLQREVVARAYLGGKTLREISQELDRPIGTIKSALSRALANLRERMPSEEGTA